MNMRGQGQLSIICNNPRKLSEISVVMVIFADIFPSLPIARTFAEYSF
jgi:hypothetical protein